MPLIKIESGAIADSFTLNNNFDYLDNRADNSTFQKYNPESTYKKGDHITIVKDGFLTCFQSKQDNNTNHPLTDNYWWEEVSISSGNGFNLFDTKVSDRILEGVEALGWALQGTFVYKNAISGSRPGYPDFYNRCLEEKQNAVAHVVNLGGSSLTLYRNTNGHEYYNISDKEIVDTWFNTFGIADWYGIDISSERIMMPRNRYYTQLTLNADKLNTYHASTITEVENSGKHKHDKGTMNIEGELVGASMFPFSAGSGVFSVSEYGGYGGAAKGPGYRRAHFNLANGWSGSTSESGDHTHKFKNTETGNDITPPSSLKFLYYCVGNTLQDVSWINIVEQVENGIAEIETAKTNALSEIDNAKGDISTSGQTVIDSIFLQTDTSLASIQDASDAAVLEVNNSKGNIVQEIENQTSHITTDFDSHVTTKTSEFDANASNKQASIDASATDAERWAIGSISERPEGSSKYWAEKAKETSAGANQDLSNLTPTGQAKFDVLANQDLSNLSDIGIAKLGIGANQDLSNLTPVGQNIANWSSNVTNCITEIPQDIKLELASDGTLTLKAGSKIYYPDGVNNFKIINTPKDTVLKYGGARENLVVCFAENGIDMNMATINYCSSGDTKPENTAARKHWYDTVNNRVLTLKDGKESQASFPIAIIDCIDVDKFTIKQVFNGFGYIGSTVFALPNVKGLIPNGRNADGSLRNIEAINTKVQINTKQSNWTQIQEQSMYDDGVLHGLAKGDFVYNQEENYMYKRFSGERTFEFVWGEAELLNGKITKWENPKQPFHAVDYNDLVNTPHIIDTYVNGTSGYSVYSNGYCEQWGYASTIWNQHVTISLLKPYKDANSYIVVGSYNCPESAAAGGGGSAFTFSSFTDKTFKIGGQGGGCGWIAKGYIK